MLAQIAIALSLTLLAPAAPVPLPGVGVSYTEKTGDPVRLSAYGLGTRSTYLRARTGATFTRQPALAEAAVSPDGRTVAGVPGSYRAGYDALLLTDRATGATRRVRTVAKPLTASYVSWTRDSGQVVLTVERKVSGRWQATGFTVVNVAAGTARTVRLSGLDRRATFWWSPDGKLVARHNGGLRIHRVTDGAVVGTHPAIGLPTGPEDSYSPSGRRLAVWCPARFREGLCLADPATGRIARRVAAQPVALFGWWDENHVIAVVTDRSDYRLAVLGLDGKVTRVLAPIPRRTWTANLWLGFTRS
ncbi:hypothetical protein [Nonomuraea cavernae]|uniref:WD40 repeat domain-containing protein n=1 Tax=Nonomuraea cavernae TaxID=2045107 RepID=A0A917Z3M5_9ACTN|nr:hypothetical protein [Nonomuraea cavernae]MCA2188368.1 hypothetical protein [Nonomuraea cavernae]GGO73539.1 hypothetical protein GCM10012289_44160 [Nonomuraea cavernae]